LARTTLTPDARLSALPGQVYCVGGAVRDALLGNPSGDTDWVVVGARPEDLAKAGFRAVGRDFPVFLHPDTGDEVALARTERKSGPGYRGFVVHADPSVTLEEDLRRRDLSINAMARDAQGRLIDPWGGAADLAAGVLRHISPAFVEDPVRLLRVARFAARWPHFTLAPETAGLLRQMVAHGEVDALVPERVWQELARGLMEPRPSRMLQVLADCGALPRVLPGLDASPAGQAAADAAAQRGANQAVRYALLAHAAPALAKHLRVPREEADLARLLGQEASALAATPSDADHAMALLGRIDGWRRPDRLAELLEACACRAQAQGTDTERAKAIGEAWLAAFQAAQSVPTTSIAQAAARAGCTGPAVGAAIAQARRDAIAQRLGRFDR
jgi:tRNA nucleotidyltransferase (CCA-adding enzyme)